MKFFNTRAGLITMTIAGTVAGLWAAKKFAPAQYQMTFGKLGL